MTADETLRVLAHPLRGRLVRQLRVGGPATATDLARALGTNSGATSYHLRRLEAAGLVADTGGGTGRRRVWRAIDPERQWYRRDIVGDDDSESALGFLARDYAAHFGEQYDRWLGVAADWPVPWQDACAPRDAMVLVTTEQLAAMTAEVAEVIERHRRIGQGNPTARRVAVYVFTYPLDLDRPPLT
ncbi:MAG: helix-turn-helix domain-containing protein [Intrasporangium sp.]|uniref:ArsR/SmtB family transcription factor n=1 Tax=Intrasporangium sp. TaxID=1925024 RepID=UPI0026478731|nr:helix-turn-helix domain-containing protein [Intrasporangium sp.]MDN5794259.1 helix-turn-helix domain-containing protein [Intrasporangium sp.]